MKQDGDKTLVNGSRVRTLKEDEIKKGPVFYWMSREQRVKDNCPLLDGILQAGIRRLYPTAQVKTIAPTRISGAHPQNHVAGTIEVGRKYAAYRRLRHLSLSRVRS